MPGLISSLAKTQVQAGLRRRIHGESLDQPDVVADHETKQSLDNGLTQIRHVLLITPDFAPFPQDWPSLWPATPALSEAQIDPGLGR